MCQKHSKYNTKGQRLSLHCNGCHGRDPTFLVHFIFHQVLGQGMRLTFTSTSHLYFKVYRRLCDYQEHFSPVLFKVLFALTWCPEDIDALLYRRPTGEWTWAFWRKKMLIYRSPWRSLEKAWLTYLVLASMTKQAATWLGAGFNLAH